MLIIGADVDRFHPDNCGVHPLYHHPHGPLPLAGWQFGFLSSFVVIYELRDCFAKFCEIMLNLVCRSLDFYFKI